MTSWVEVIPLYRGHHPCITEPTPLPLLPPVPTSPSLEAVRNAVDGAASSPIPAGTSSARPASAPRRTPCRATRTPPHLPAPCSGRPRRPSDRPRPGRPRPTGPGRYQPLPRSPGDLAFAGPDTVAALPRELAAHLVDGYLPVRMHNLAHRPVLLQRHDEPDLPREAAAGRHLPRPRPGRHGGRPPPLGRRPRRHRGLRRARVRHALRHRHRRRPVSARHEHAPE